MAENEPKRNQFSRRRWESNAVAATGIWADRRRLAAAMRLVIERLIASDAPEDELRAEA